MDNTLDYLASEEVESEDSVEYDISYTRMTVKNENFTPVCNKISTLLNTFGYSTVQLIPSDVDTETNSISLFVIESWADTILSAVQELCDRLNNQKTLARNASFTSRIGDVSKDTLQVKIQELKSKLAESEKREKNYESRIAILESSNAEKSKSVNSEEINTKKTIKNLELQMQESERRARQKEAELNRLKSKMQAFIEREKETSSKNKKIFTQFQQGDISFSSVDKSPTNTPAKKNSSHNNSNVSKLNNSSSSDSTAISVLEALEDQRSELMLRNKELELQVRDLSAALKDHQNEARKSKTVCAVPHKPAVVDGGRDNEERKEELTPVARKMYDKIVEQQEVIEQLQHKVEISKSMQAESENIGVHLRNKAIELREEIDNLKLELESRPSMKQWTAIQREYQEMEDKLQDLTVMRGDSAEIAMWRKHLSTHDRIKIDKRNHELGLWLIDSLPKTVMKETLQTICRELDVSDISDIVGCIGKLKAVVKTVPRMERFISQTCAFVFQRDPTLELKIAGRKGTGVGRSKAESKEASCMEDIFPMLKRWWSIALKSFEYEEFCDKVLEELHRREYMISNMTSELPRRDVKSEVTTLDLKDQWLSVGRMLWAQRDPVKTIQILRDLVDFQVEVMNNKQSLLHADEFIRDKPEVIVNRIVSHIQYIFEVKSIEGILPRMNQVYLFTEEMRNFLSTVRAILANEPGGLSYTAAVPNSTLLAEIERRLTIFGTVNSNNRTHSH